MIQSSTISGCHTDADPEGPVISFWDFHICGQNYSHLSQPQMNFLQSMSLPLLGLASEYDRPQYCCNYYSGTCCPYSELHFCPNRLNFCSSCVCVQDLEKGWCKGKGLVTPGKKEK